MTSVQEVNRLFGPSNRPHYNTNVRHRAILRKLIELFSVQDLEAIFERPIKLRVAMGSSFTASQLGKIITNHVSLCNSILLGDPALRRHQVHNGRLVSRETPVPDAEAQDALQAYRQAYDAYFKKQGNDYRVNHPQAKSVLQAAEQTWHDWVITYRGARGMPGRPPWALQPLPGFDQVQLAPAPAPAPAATSPARRRYTQAALPTPPPSSPTRPDATPLAPLRVGSRLLPITVSDEDLR
jgi:hypothetical protein